MELQLFSYIDETLKYYDMHLGGYEYAMGQIQRVFKELMESKQDVVISFSSRIKTRKSLQEKLIRNQFYLDYASGEESILNLHDLIGITIQCRFIRNEHELYQYLLKQFESMEEGYAQCKVDQNTFLNIKMPQPQYQRNGFTIYRMDGYYMFNGNRINFELQIKSLVHNFWSDIEHQVVYKNPDFVVYDRFNKSMLGAIRDNLDVVDRQLEIMYNEISQRSQDKQIGMDEKGFKVFVARSINELVNAKMMESVGFTTDFKKCSAILAQYIYVRDFLNGTRNRDLMVEYLEHLNFLATCNLDFKQEIYLEHPFESDDKFTSILGNYWEKVMNTNFQWHIFFAMLFSIQPGNNYEDFEDFISVIKMLIVQPGWYIETFSSYTVSKQKQAQNDLLEVLASGLVEVGSIDIVHEENLLKVMDVFKKYIHVLEERYPKFDDFENDLPAISSALLHQIRVIFK